MKVQNCHLFHHSYIQIVCLVCDGVVVHFCGG